MVSVNRHPARSRPRSLVLRSPAADFAQPNASSIRLRMTWLVRYPARRVVCPSSADPLAFAATWGETFMERKRELFGDDPRVILQVEVIDTADGIHVMAAHTL